jgi:hypothetical protein
LTIPPGGAVSIDAGGFFGLDDVLVRNSDNAVIGALQPPKAPPAVSLEAGDVIHLCAALNSAAHESASIWFELTGVPKIDKAMLELELKINGPQPGFILIRNSTNKDFAAAKIASVKCAGLQVKQNPNGDWYVDARKPADPPLQTVLIDYSLPAAKQPTFVLIDASLVSSERVLMPLDRAVLIDQDYHSTPSAPIHGNLVKNRPNRGR